MGVSNFSGEKGFTYEGSDLTDMDNAVNYHNWIIDNFEKYLGTNLLEVGAGIGTLTKIISQRKKDLEITCLEPSNEMYPLLKKTVDGISTDKIKYKKNFTYEISKKLAKEKFDSVIYNNVLEHVEDDVDEMRNAHDILVEGGYIITYSPAMQLLFSGFDKSIGHYRRYSLKEMKSKMEQAGFEIVEAYYMDIVGSFLWWLKFKLLGSKELGGGNLSSFDKFIIPILAKLEPSKMLPFGKNIMVIGKKIK